MGAGVEDVFCVLNSVYDLLLCKALVRKVGEEAASNTTETNAAPANMNSTHLSRKRFDAIFSMSSINVTVQLETARCLQKPWHVFIVGTTLALAVCAVKSAHLKPRTNHTRVPWV